MWALLIALAALALNVVTATGSDFSNHWNDGKAELDGYKLEVSRYGQTRSGYAVMIYVTEPFSESKRVKVDDQRRSPDDTFEALKLNLVRDFQTGIYDYNTMVSTFVRASDFAPVKVTFTSAEWCGHVYEELLFDRGKVRGQYFSYFEDESGAFDLGHPTGGVSEDNLFILLRGLRGEYLAPGKSRSVDYLPGVFHSRVSHQPLEWTKARISRSQDTRTVTVPAGEYETTVYTIDIDGGRSGIFHVEAAYPHRIVKWSLTPDSKGELTGSKRLAYWRLNGEGEESRLKDIGLGDLSSK
jgi:hypothetical protein